MGSDDRDGNRLIKANFSADGAVRLKESLMEKLKEFMGDYTDDTLVDYVIVLLRNGRHKEQARNDLNVFLGENSDSFVSWLWDHLDIYLDSYVQPEALLDEAPKKRFIAEVQAGEDDSQHLNSQSERGKSSKLSRSRHNKDWKGLMRGEAESPSIRSSVVDNAHLELEANQGPRSLSPKPPVQKKRGRADEQPRMKRDVVSQVNIAAPRRLLQFAVRDAVATSRTATGMSVEPSLKRLRSVVSTSAGDSSFVERPQRMQLASRVSNPMATMIKAVAEAAEDVIKSKPSGSVFDRLGRGIDTSDDNRQLEDSYQHQEQHHLFHSQRTEYNGGVSGASQISPSVGNRGNDSLMVQYSVAKNVDDSLRQKRNREQEQLAASPNTSHKIVNISVNVNTWKPPQHQVSREVTELDGNITFYNERGDPRSSTRLVKENASTLKVSNGNANPALDVQKEFSKAHLTASGSNAAGRPSEDVDSRTIFVSNVHFAATKDGLSRHFNRFGDVLKVIIVTDAATGQPKGAAYVEFMRKEAADNALSLDNTSFMSRILKVIKKSATPQESAPAMAWPRIVKGSPFPSARFSRHPFPRGIPGVFRARPPIKLGARSMQWKRDAQGSGSDSSTSVNTGNVAAPVGRGFTYIRTESKPEGSLGTTT
ncbi:Polyadenylate-binding protein 2 isoform C [Glycine soja]|uniref:Polyadenylate-binding protein 2 isoform C n=1 Tax=Glycine soja TaxID=3848 RepID=A0A445GZ40_GLYSO|nr:Polyadenylate-binding protein 2 isoform C [Glycine soja]